MSKSTLHQVQAKDKKLIRSFLFDRCFCRVSGSGTGMPPMPTDPETCAKVLKKQQEARGTAPAAGSAPKTKRSDAE